MMNQPNLAMQLEGANAFQANVEDYFRAKGYQLMGYTPMVTGFLLILCRQESLQLAYCLSTLLSASSVDVDLCERAIRKYDAAGGYVITRSTFLPGALSRAQELGIQLIDGSMLKPVRVR